MLSRSDRHRRSLAVFVGQPPGSPVLEPCPLLFMADEWMHGPLLWGQIAAALGFRDDVFFVTTLQSPLPGLPGEQLLMTPRSLPWRYAWLPVDLRAVGGRICMLMCVRDSSCQAIAQLAITAQELQLRVDGLLGRCHWGWLTLSSQPLFLQGVDALQFASGPGPESLQAPLGASLDPPLSLLSAMQVSLPSGQAGADIFQGYSNNQAILITPNGLVYVEVPVFADAATFRRIVSFRASPTARGGVMRIWQPLPSLPLVQFLEIHCHSDEVPCILDFRPLGWRIVTACVRPPITALRMLDEAIRRNNGGIPADWLDQCADGRFGLLHRESIVLPDQLLHGNLPVVVMFFPHIFRQDSSSSSEQQVGGRPPPSGEDADGRPPRSKFTAPLGLRAKSCKGRHLPGIVILLPPPLAHVDLQGMWQRTGDFGDALLWPSLGDSSRRFLVTCKIWAPESSLVLQFLGDMDAGEVAAELHRQAVRLGRPHLVAASTGPTFDKVHLVAAASGREHITVLVDACVDICCVDLPAAYTSRDVIVAVAQFLQHDAFQILWGRGLRLRHGDVVTVKPARPTQHFDISSLLLPLPKCSTAAWLAPVRHVSVVQAAEGVHTFSVPASTTVTAEVLRLLMSKTCTGKFSFFDLPFPDVLPHASFVAIGRRQCVVVYRVNDRADPASLGLILCFEGRFVSYDEFLLQLASRTELPARLLRSLQSHGMTVVLGALPMIPGDNVWEPDPFIVEGEGVGIHHAAVLRVNDLARDLAYHAARLWQGLAEPDAEPVGDSGRGLQASATPTRPVDLLDLDPSRGDRDASPAAAWWILCFGRQAGTFLRHLHLVGCVLLLPGWVSASIISPPGSSSDEEGSSPATVTTFNAATHGAGRAPHVRPAGPPPPIPANAPPVASRILYLQAATPVEDYSLGQWPPVGPARATVSPSAVTTVQVQLSQFQHGVRAVVDAIPPGTPICIHNPFTARAQCSWLEYHAGVEISPFTVFQDHANHRGWRGLALLHPQPDALAVHLIGQPLHPDNAAVGIVLRDRLVPCCLPRCVRASALHSLHVGDDVCDLHFSGLIHDEADTVQLRDGDCLGARIRPPRPSATRLEVAYATPASADAGAPVAEDRSSSILGALGWAASPLRYLGLFLFGRGWRHAGPGWIVVCFGTLAVSAMHRPGGFPWGEHPRNRELRDITAHDPVYVVLHSPFLGAYPAYTASRDTRHHVIWAQFLNDEPAWPADFFPVWPGPAFNELSIVPIGADPAIVTLMLQWRGLPRAIVTPRVMTVKWLMSLIARLVGQHVGEIAVPHGLAVAEFFDVPPAALKFRNGDVVYALEAQDADDEALQVVEPWHLQDGLAAQHAPWALGFRLMFDVQVQLLRPDRPPVLARVAAEEAWCPESHCFSGDFQLRFPGMWTPVQWTSARQVQLVQVCNVAAQVHVIVATPGERLCRVSDRFVSKYTLASSLNLDPASVCVGGIPAYALEQSCELRNGDVVFCNAEQGDSSGSVGPLARTVLAAVLWAAVTHWPDRVGWSLLAMLVLGQCANHDGTLFGCHAMQLQAAPVAGPMSAEPGVPRASAPSRLMQVHVADPFAAWTVVRVDESEIFPSLLEVCPGALASWHRGFAIADATSVGLHVAVPHPGRGLVCVLIVGLGQRLCVLLPAFLTLRAAERAVSLRMGQLVALQLGPGLVAESRQLGAFLALRTGDTLGVRLVSTLSFAMTPPLPHFPTWQRAHAEGAWRTDFVVDHPSSLLLWRPNCPTRLLCVGPNQRWSAAQATILGDDTPFAEGRWTPCVGHQGVIPWLLLQATEPSQVHVIRTHSCTECVAINRDAAYDMWIDGFQVRPPTARPDKITRIREGDWWLKAVASGGGLVSGASRGSRFFLLLAVSFLHFPAVSAASSSEGCRSPDSSEARTIRSRGRWDARSRSRSPPLVVHFPPRIDWTDGEPFILHAGWRLHEGDGLTAFDQCYLRPDQATVRTLCPILGWSAAEAADLGRSWTYFDRIGQRFCGSWGTRFFPVRGVRPLTEVVLAPVAPCGLATVIIHTLDETGAFLLPVDTTPAAIQAAAAMRSPQVRSWHLMLPPALRAVHEHQVIRLRNGDLFGLQPCPGQPGYAPRPTLNFPSLEVARQVASWSLPFRFDTGDTATFWSTSSRVGRSVTIRGGGIWDPRGPTFRSLNGQQMLGSWVPVLQGGLTRLHFVSRTLPVEALVICLIPPTDEPIGVFLAGICACRPPFGWRLVPSIRRSRAGGSLRDADVLEVDPDATFTWDPFDGRPPLLAEDTPGQADRQVDPDSSWDLGFPAAISAASCVLSKRSFSWALLLYGWLSLSGVWGMCQPVDTAPAPVRAGFFPWRAPTGHENMQDLTERATLEVVYVSPFTGPQVLGQVPTSESPDHLLDRASQLEPGWGTGIAPVWPATPLPFLMVVPQPPCLDLVCVVVSSLEDHFALCIPRVAPLEWIAQVLRYSHSLHALSLRAPATVRDLASDVYWRSGDLLVALPPAVFEPTYSPPCFATATQLRHCAIWSVDFSVSSTIEVVLWRPSVRPLRSRIPALARWNALDLTFEGVFAQRFPGRWAPVPWAADDLPHLVQCSQSADDVTVIVESSVGCFCSEIPACVDAWQLWTALPTLPSQPQVLGVPKAELRHGTLLRNGDVVSGTSPREQLPVWIALSLSLLWRWPCLGGASLLFILTPEVRAVRTPASGTNTEYLHRVWNPAGMVQGPFPGPSHRCPDVLRHSIPAWDHFVRVRPTQHVAFIDWVPAPPDPDSVIVLLHGGVSSRAVMLPWRASPQEVLDRLRAFAPLASSVSATPAAWRGTSLSRSPILYLRSGDVLCLDSVSWYPRLRQPRTLEWPTVQFAAAFAFWGHSFKVLEPGLIFAWQSGAVLPLCVPTVRGERWDPSRGTFFPSLAPFSFSRWVPAVRVDPLGLHLVEESTQGTIAHTLACTYPPRVCATEVCLSPYAPRDGDDFGRRTTGIPGLGLWIGFLTQGARLRCRPAFYILGLLWLPLFVGSGPMPHPHAWRPGLVIYPDLGISQLSGRAFSSWDHLLATCTGVPGEPLRSTGPQEQLELRAMIAALSTLMTLAIIMPA
ncbi:unnamed protein product [Symbiodinium sp. CCMP2592]|nr:unnamed protein product [Symbiodinium sp. CCMP2592]